MKKVKIYLKIHRITGKKYVGKTTEDDVYRYQGSGKYWLRHIKKHGYNCDTVVLFESDNIKEVEAFALKYSEENNITKSDDYLNLKSENGLDGNPKGIVFSKEWCENISKTKKGISKPPRSKEHSENLSKARKGKCQPNISKALKGKKQPNVSAAKSKEWIITDPYGNRQVICNLKIFCIRTRT